MKLAQKLWLSQSPYDICFFKEGVFGWAYDVLLYLATLNLPLEIKTSLVNYKQQPNQTVFKGGVPLNWLLKHYQNQLIHYNWGYKLKDDSQVELADYQRWQIEMQKNASLPPALYQDKLAL